MSCGADTLANQLITSLIADGDFELPDGAIPEKIGNDALTTGQVGGVGAFDIIMKSIKAHLREEYEANRIMGDQYAKAYIELTAAALQTSVQFLLGRDTSFWQSILLLRQTATAQAEYALTKMKLSTEDQNYCNLIAQKNLLDKQIEVADEQIELTKEQVESARAQTLNTRRDGTTIVGSIGKQKDLYTQQITSYTRDSEIKAGKLFQEAWITIKTLNESAEIPNAFFKDNISEIMTRIRNNNDLD